MIGKDYRDIKSSSDLINFCNKYSLYEIHEFLKSKCGLYLGSKLHGAESQKTFGKISDIRRVYGAGLLIMSERVVNLSENSLYCCELVFNAIKKNNFNLYSKTDGIIAYVCILTVSKTLAQKLTESKNLKKNSKQNRDESNIAVEIR